MLGLPHFALNDVCYEDISQIILFEDESLEILFRDRSVLQLSSCGANFKYTRPCGLGHEPAIARQRNEISQRCVFATSETRSKVIQAILIRNQISSHPYLPTSLLVDHTGMETFRLYKDVRVFEWPKSTDGEARASPPEENDSGCSVFSHSDGSVSVTSKDNFAKLVLFPDGHRVHVKYVAKVSKCEKKGQQKDSGDSSKNNNTYMWQNRIFPANFCPKEWEYPLALAMNNKLSQSCAENFSLSPSTTPLACPKQFVHEWRNVIAYSATLDPSFDTESQNLDMTLPLSDTRSSCQLNIKLLWNDFTTFWLNASSQHSNIEVWLSNGAVFKTHPTSDRYYVHLYPSLQKGSEMSAEELYVNGKFMERTVSASTLPQQDTRLKSVMLRSIRLVTYCKQQMQYSASASSSPCWKAADEEKDESIDNDGLSGSIDEGTVHEKVIVKNIGTFSAVDDSVQIMFEDDAMLHMTIDIRGIRSGKVFDFSSLQKDQCRLILANGKYFVVSNLLQSQPEIGDYLKPAKEWIEWLVKPVAERRDTPFYSDTIHNPEKSWTVSRELDKIRRFDYILSRNKVFGGESSHEKDCDAHVQYMELSGDSHSNMSFPTGRDLSHIDVRTALSNTSKAIDDLDSVIKSIRADNVS